jgi:hypothetical protein
MKCSDCENWERQGNEGICYGGQPQPKIMEAGKSYTMVWPVTSPNARCECFCPVEDEDINNNTE